MDFDFSALTDVTELIETVLGVYFDLYESVCNLVGLITGTFFVTLPIFVIVLGVTSIGRQRLAPWVRYSLWTLVLIRLILPVSVASPISAQRLWSAIQVDLYRDSESVKNRLLNIALPSDLQSTNSTSEDEDSAVSPKASIPTSLISNSLSSLWTLLLAGSILLAVGSGIAFIQLSLWIRNGNDCSDACCLELVEQGRRLYGLRARVRLQTVPQLNCPATFDWFRPTILLPEYTSTLSAAERRHIVWHELARIRRGDSSTSVLLAVVGILHWWNPLFWAARQRWLTDREFACDELAISLLTEEQAEGFGETLERLHARMPGRSRSIFWCDAPGYILMIASRSTLHRRIERLRHLGNALQQSNREPPVVATSERESIPALDFARMTRLRTESRWQYWFSWCLLLTLAVSGLTDEVKLSPAEYPIDLPVGTSWHDSAAIEQTSEAAETRSYDLRPCIDRLRNDEPNLPAEMAEENLRQQFESMLRPINSADRTIVNAIDPVTSGEPKCRIIDGQLVVLATPHQHAQIATLLSNWTIHGQQQISIEFRAYMTQRQLSQLLPAGGGQVINSQPVMHQIEFATPGEADNKPQLITRTGEHSPVPAFIQVLTSNEAFRLVRHIWPQGRVSVMFAPKVTIFEGSTATISTESIRPFATGFLTSHSGTLEPHISTFQDGMRVHTFAYVDSGKIHLSVGCQISQILDVQVRKLQSESKEMNIQIPKVHETILESAAELNEGESLILVPLQRSERGDLTIFLITPRIVIVNEPEVH